MEWLEAGVAFAIVMMIFSTMVSIIIETAHRIFRLREKGFGRLITHVYEDILEPRLTQRLSSNGKAHDDFIEKMTSGKFHPIDKSATGIKNGLYTILNAKQVKSLSTYEFIQRFAETSAGQTLYAEAERRGESYLRIFIEDLASKYEEFGEGAREYFARRSRFFSIIAAIGLAFALNINAVQIFKILLVDDDVRKVVISQGEAIAENMQAQIDSTKDGEELSEEQIQKITENNEKLRELGNDLADMGIPIGWKFGPWQHEGWNSKAKFFDIENLTLYFPWGLAVLFTGLLVGLGGPFWYDTFRKLTALTSIARSFQSAVQKNKEQDKTQTDEHEQDVVNIFKNSSKATALTQVRGRKLLSPDGSIDKGV